MSKDRSDDLIENGTLEFPVELELHLTGILAQGDEIPLPREMLKRAIYKDHINGFGAVIDIPGMKELGNALEMNINLGI